MKHGHVSRGQYQPDTLDPRKWTSAEALFHFSELSGEDISPTALLTSMLIHPHERHPKKRSNDRFPLRSILHPVNRLFSVATCCQLARLFVRFCAFFRVQLSL
jgi:hypothetical protein